MASASFHSHPSAAASPPPPPLVPPAPITASIHASTARLRQNRALPDSMVLLRRQEKQLHDDLQDLLYQQDEALRLAQGAPAAHDDADLSGSATPTARSLADEHRHPHQRRHSNIRGIRAVRKAIRTAVSQLATVKAEEGRLLGHDRAGNDAVVRKLASWAEQRDGLETQIRTIEQGEEGAHTAALKDEAQVLQDEIWELEDKLRAAKARHRKLLADVAEIENSVQSKLSSYKASLSILEADINGFLRTCSARDRQASEAPFFKIPPRRRTLDLAREHWDEEQANTEKLRQESETERDALEQGAVMWDNIVHRITEFEKHIAEATMHQGSGTDPTAEAKHLIADLTETINYVESQLDLAEERGWKLLVACIGAELNALHEGRRMLEAMLQAAGETSPTIEREKRLGDVEIEFQPSSLANSQTLQQNGDASGVAASKQAPARQPRPNYHSTDEDEPDPELLISHQDTDDEHLR
ncbi:autophagy-related protein atg28 [Diplodia corticola]|uniref:Autophagy-related protein atg28 n=1 Tax=Diplodia corticola TaxID=236234 RepID=A0A1J9RM50_9PEZI|nr:autophagy-related protein atg28 [Diplodia corticola]OJD33651.1 autophagy-related protein atg28 [Diplodia corticola]